MVLPPDGLVRMAPFPLARDERAGVAAGYGDFRHLTDGELVRNEVQGIRTDKVVLDIDAVIGHVGIGGAQSVDCGDGSAVGYSGLSLKQERDLPVEHRQIVNLGLGNRGGHFRAGGIDRLCAAAHLDGLRGAWPVPCGWAANRFREPARPLLREFCKGQNRRFDR